MTTTPLEQTGDSVATDGKVPVLAALPDADPGTNEPTQSPLAAATDNTGGTHGTNTPAVKSIPLPGGEGEQETFYELKMAWSGKTYELKIGANDL